MRYIELKSEEEKGEEEGEREQVVRGRRNEGYQEEESDIE